MPRGFYKRDDSIHQHLIDRIVAMSFGESMLILDYTWNSVRTLLAKYAKDNNLIVSIKSFMIDDDTRIVVKIKPK